MSGNNRDDDHLNDIFNMQSPQWKKNFGDVQSSSPVNGGMVYGGMPEQPMVMGLEGDILGEPLNGETINGPKPENAVPMNNWTSVNSDNLRQLDTLYHEGDDLLSPINLQGGQGHQAPQQLLDPKSPSVYSAYSGHTDTSLHPASPYMDAVSHFSSAYSNISTHQPPPPGFLPAGNNFEGEIALGASISNINLNRFFDHEDAPRKTEQPLAGPTGLTGLLDTGYGHVDRLTENNLTNYDSQYNKEVKISIQTPEEVAGKAPSLFSNSSANSSTHFSADPLSNDHLQSEHGLAPNSNYLSSPGSAVSDSNSLLNPEELQSMKRGRRKSHSYKQQKSRSRSISKSPAVSDDEGDNLQVSVSSREKMLELASPNQSSKRTQKHPSVYACHLCDKRFTRPYNLKSHLRTHTDERPFICNVCGKAFARQHDRKRHEDLHTGEKKFQCKGFLKDGTPYGCGRKFARADALRRHFQTEAGKECIRLLVEEDERDKQNGGTGRTFDGNDYLSPGSAMMASNASVPQVAISPPD